MTSRLRHAHQVPRQIRNPAVAELLYCIRDLQGFQLRKPAVEYQLLTAKLHSLQKALDYLDKLSTCSGHNIKTVESIKFAAAACQRPWQLSTRKSGNTKKFRRSCSWPE